MQLIFDFELEHRAAEFKAAVLALGPKVDALAQRLKEHNDRDF